MNLTDLTASQAVRFLRSGEISAEDYVKACLDRISAREEEVQAWVHLDPEHALAQARAADEQRRQGKGIGPLHGLPVGIKDIINTGGHADPERLCAVQGLPAARRRLLRLGAAGRRRHHHGQDRDDGAGHAHAQQDTQSPQHGAHAGRLVIRVGGGGGRSHDPCGAGTQTGGSVIRPASFCGIYGLKPTLGLISRRGVTLQAHTLDTVGVYGRSLEDLALLADALSAHDPDDPVSYPRGRTSLSQVLAETVPVPPLFAFCKTPPWEQADAVMREAFEKLVGKLGDRVREVPVPSLDEAFSKHQPAVQGAENAAYYGPLLARAPDGISPGLTARLEVGAKVLAKDYIAAINAREAHYAAIEDVLRHYTAILTPASAGPAPKGLGSTGSPAFNAVWTYLGVPCVTLPLLEADGLPLGVQLVGMRRDEGRLLRTGRWLVEHLRK